MQATFFRSRKASLILAALTPIFGGCSTSRTVVEDDVPTPVPVAVQPAPEASPAPVAAVAPTAPDAPTAPPPPLILSGPTTPDAGTVSAMPPPPPAPATPPLTPAAQEVVKLAQSGVSEDVMLAYTGNSNDRFNLGSDQIIYLNDLGVPQAVVKSMIQRDTMLAATPAPTTPPVEAVPPATPPPAYIADQSTAPPPPTYPDYNAADYSTPDASSDYFYSSLAPYGTWVEVGGYGRCWRPTVCAVNPGWQPYCDSGRWIDTDSGWYWQSDYSWGWAPFHYGRWFRDARAGWVWRPDSCWGPAWVSWRHSSDYCGWAPLPPEAVFVPGLGFRFHNHSVGVDFEFGLGLGVYTFVPLSHFCDDHPHHHRIPPAQVTQVFNHTTVINNITIQDKHVINHGIDPRNVAAASHKEIHKVVLQDLAPNAGTTVRPDHLDRTGQKLVVWRPQLPATTGNAGTTTGSNADRPGNHGGRPNSGFPNPPMANGSPAVPPADNHHADLSHKENKDPVPVHMPKEDRSPVLPVPQPTQAIHPAPPLVTDNKEHGKNDHSPAPVSTPQPLQPAPIPHSPVLANQGQLNPPIRPTPPAMSPPLFRNPSFGVPSQTIHTDPPKVQAELTKPNLPYRAPQPQPQPAPVVRPTPVYTPPSQPLAVAREPVRPTYIAPTPAAPAYVPHPSPAPVHVAPPASAFSENHYQPSYSPPPAAAPPAYRAPVYAVPAPAPAPAYHAPAAESHSAPAQQPSSNSSSSQSSSKNH